MPALSFASSPSPMSDLSPAACISSSHCLSLQQSPPLPFSFLAVAALVARVLHGTLLLGFYLSTPNSPRLIPSSRETPASRSICGSANSRSSAADRPFEGPPTIQYSIQQFGSSTTIRLVPAPPLSGTHAYFPYLFRICLCLPICWETATSTWTDRPLLVIPSHRQEENRDSS